MSNFILSGFADEIDQNLDVQIKAFKGLGIDHIEMRAVNGKGLVEHTIEEAKAIKQKLDINNIRLSAIGSPIGKILITDAFEPHLELFKHTLEIARIMETKYIRMFSFFIPKGENPDQYKKEVVARWQAFLSAAKDYEVVLLHENEKDIYGDIPKRCVELIKALNSDKVKMVFDPANYIQCGVEAWPTAYELTKEHVVYYHIKDAKLDNGENVPAGFGDGRIDKILKDAYKTGFEGFLSLEPHLYKFKGLAALEIDAEDVVDVDIDGTEKFRIAFDALKNIICNIVKHTD